MSQHRPPVVVGAAAGLALVGLVALLWTAGSPADAQPEPPRVDAAPLAETASTVAPRSRPAPLPAAEAPEAPEAPQEHSAALAELQAWSRLAAEARADEAHLVLLERRLTALEEAADAAMAAGDDAYAAALLRRRNALEDRYAQP